MKMVERDGSEKEKRRGEGKRRMNERRGEGRGF